MSSVSGLFADAKTDSKLDGLFSSKNAGPVKRSIGERTVIDLSVKRSKKKRQAGNQAGEEKVEEQKADSEQDAEEEEEEEQEEEEQQQPKPKNKKRSYEDEDEDLESKYYDKILSKENESKEEQDSSEEEEEKEEEITLKTASAAKKIDLKEDETEKAERTIFIGNLNSTVITSKKEYKAFKKQFLQYGEIDSVRFRSIAFTEALPRKVAFVQQKLHSSRDSVNAYVVYKTKEESRKALSANGEVFAGLHLRVDSVAHPAKIDNNRTIFVGNLDFEEKEEELWSIFLECGDIESVRIVRDSKTNVGKGFGYVQFKDFLSVSKALFLNEKELGEKKRKLRISRAKKMRKPVERGGDAKGRHKNLPNLNDNQKTRLGRAKRVLGKADRATAGKHVVEGTRAKKGDVAVGIKNGKNRVKKPRIRQRSTDFRNAQRATK